MRLVHLTEGLRIFRRSIAVRRSGFRKYKGSASQVCSKIVDECFNGKYFQTSTGHFCEFYTRDFGWCIDSLLKLGYRDKVLKTLGYALGVFEKHGRTATTISPSGKPFDFPFYAPDSLAFLVRSLESAKAGCLVKKHKSFLNNEIMGYFEAVIDKGTGLVRKDRHFSSMKDHSLRKSSCYDNVMTAVLAESAGKLGLANPFKGHNFRKIIRDNFWNGNYFDEDLSGSRAVTGDSNVFPFWTGVFSSRKMLKSAVNSVQAEGLDRPFPLRYAKSARIGKQKFIWLELFVKNYERNTVWTHMGPLFVSLVKKISKNDFEKYLGQYKRLIESNKNYLELFTPEGKPYSTPFYHSDEGMLWAANFLAL